MVSKCIQGKCLPLGTLEMQDGHGDVQEVQVQGSGLKSIHIMTLACARLHGCP